MKVSILSPVYNEADHIDEMVVSVQAQTYQDWELLFVDDGSDDSTARRIESHAFGDSRIRVISAGVKLGKVAAFNCAYAASTGGVIVLLAGDDRLPPESLTIRHAAISALPERKPTVGFFKLRTFSVSKKFDGMVLPRGNGASRSGGSITMNRTLGDLLFPINETLVSEDIWLAYAAVDLAQLIVERPNIVLEYRIHDGNSHPRSKPFAQMNESMHQRHRAWQALLQCPQFQLTARTTAKLQSLWAAEQLRYRGRTARLLLVDIPLIDRAAMASMSSPWLFTVRSRYYSLFSGRRGQ